MPVQAHHLTSDLAYELEAAGLFDGLSSSERASIIQQVQAEEIALGAFEEPALFREVRDDIFSLVDEEQAEGSSWCAE